MDVTDEIAEVKAKLKALEVEVNTVSKKEKPLILQRIIATQNYLNILVSKSALPGKKFSFHSIDIIPMN